jgi:hypothetical protein
MVMALTPEELEKKKQMVLSMCICAGCPSWIECGEEGGFCFPTKNSGAKKRKEITNTRGKVG